MTINIARTFALSVVSAGIIGGAALGMAGANAATPAQPAGPGHMFTPSVKAHPAPEALPGWHGRHGAWRIEHFEPGYRP